VLLKTIADVVRSKDIDVIPSENGMKLNEEREMNKHHLR
jgi:hypothetical protein